MQVEVRNRLTGASFMYDTTATSEKEAKRNAGVRFAKEHLNGMHPKRFFGSRWRRGKRVRLSDKYTFKVV